MWNIKPSKWKYEEPQDNAIMKGAVSLFVTETIDLCCLQICKKKQLNNSVNIVKYCLWLVSLPCLLAIDIFGKKVNSGFI